MSASALLDKVEFDPFGGCWLWSGALHSGRYPRLKVEGRDEMAARVSWQLVNGPVPAGLLVTTLCSTAICVNPNHLAAVPKRRAAGVLANAERQLALFGTLAQRIESSSRHNPATGCREWTARLIWDGYGEITVSNRKRRAHRVAYELRHGQIPVGLVIDHLCRNRACVNPDHLEAVTPAENSRRGEGFSARNAAKTHCDHGHALAGGNLYITPKGHRGCRACNAASARRYAARRRSAP